MKYKKYKIYKKKGKKHFPNKKQKKLPPSCFLPPYTLQQALGNKEVQQLFEQGFLAAKLKISKPGDDSEREADKVAEKIVAKDGNGIKQAKKGPQIQKRPSFPMENNIPNQLKNKLTANKGPGRPFPKHIRNYYEPRFGVDLGDVRMHAETNADRLARAIRARAFTYGKDIYFAQGEFKPETYEGKKLVAHELTHVLQQRDMSKKIIQRQKMPDIDKVNTLVSQGRNIVFLLIQGGENPTYYEHPYDMDEKLFIDLETLEYIDIDLKNTDRFLHTSNGIMDTEVMLFIDEKMMRYKWSIYGQEYATEYDIDKNTKTKNISKKGIEFIYSYEAPNGAELQVYDDGYGNPTIGYGHMLQAGEKFPDGITIEQAVDLFRADIKIMVDAVNNYITVPINQYQFDALVSLTYTMGPDGFYHSTVRTGVNNKQPVKSNWYAHNKATDKDTGKLVYSQGLQNRRYDEYELFSKGDYKRDHN